MSHELAQKHCVPCEGGVPPMDRGAAEKILETLPGWALSQSGTEIACTYQFKNYYETMAFVNALAYISHREDHHPDLEVTYNRCVVHYSTHAIGGLSENDFICAAKANGLKQS